MDHSELVPAKFPKSRGIRVGVVAGTTRRGVLVQLEPVSSNGRMTIDPGDAPLKERQLLTEEDFRKAREQFGDTFQADMGADGRASDPARG